MRQLRRFFPLPHTIAHLHPNAALMEMAEDAVAFPTVVKQHIIPEREEWICLCGILIEAPIVRFGIPHLQDHTIGCGAHRGFEADIVIIALVVLVDSHPILRIHQHEIVRVSVHVGYISELACLWIGIVPATMMRVEIVPIPHP